jgi:hypothetical protein
LGSSTPSVEEHSGVVAVEVTGEDRPELFFGSPDLGVGG